jgi:lycopene cyclase domain-containing protein
MASLFLLWDAWFTHIGVWQFNHEYVLGPHIFNMPFEEYLFFFCIPYACVFTHEALKFYIPYTIFDSRGKSIGLTISFVIITLGCVLFYLSYIKKTRILGRFFFTYFITLIPFLLVNGFLTSMPVLIYDDTENLGVRVGTIPLDDFFYWMLLLLGNVILFDRFKKKGKA